MPKYKVYVEGVTDWSRNYIIEAESAEKAEEIAAECDPDSPFKGVKVVDRDDSDLHWDAQVAEIK